MVTVTRWTGRHARVLREVALRMSIYEFAAHTGLSTSTIREIEAKGERARLRTSTQRILDEALAGAGEDSRRRFAAGLADTATAYLPEQVESAGVGGGVGIVAAASRAETAAAVGCGRWAVGGEGVVETDRRQALATAFGLAAATLSSVNAAGSGASPAPVDGADELLLTVTRTYRRLERGRPSDLLVGPVTGCVDLARSIIDEGGVAGWVCAVLSEAAGLAAWLYVDLDNAAGARGYYRLAVAAAERSGHDLLPAYMQASLGQFAAESGDTGYGDELVRRARARLGGTAPPLAYVWLDSVEALVLAHRGEQEALDLLRGCEKRLATAGAAQPVWPWVFTFDEAKHAAYRARCAARLGRIGEAKAAFADASSAVSAPKQHAALAVEHARVLCADGDLDGACTLVASAVDTAASLRSQRIGRQVRHLRHTIGDRAGRLGSLLDEHVARSYGQDR